MPLTIEELLINMGVDVTAFRANLAVAEKSLEGVVEAGDRVKASLAGVETAGGSLADALQQVGAEGDKVRAEFQQGITEGITSELSDMQKAAASVGEAMQSVGQNLGSVDQSQRKLASSAAQTTAAIASMAAASDLSAAGVQRLALGLAGIVAQSGLASPAIASLTTGLLAFGAAAAAGAVAGNLLGGGFKQLGDSLEKIGNRKAALSDSSAQIKEINATLANVKADVAASKIKTFADQTEALVQRVKDARVTVDEFGQEHVVAAGQVDSAVAALRKMREELAFNLAATESQDAGKKLSEEIRAGVEAGIAEIEKLKAAINVKPSEETIAGLRKLGTSLDFKGPIGELQQLQTQLDETSKAITAAGQKAGFDPATIAKEIAEAQAKLKTAFKEKIKVDLALNAAAAEAEAQKALDKIERLPPARTSLAFSEDTLARLLAERSTILSRIADAPTATLKLEAQADLTQVDKDIAAERAKQEADDVVVPVSADTSGFRAAMEAEARRVHDNLVAALDAVSGKSKSLGAFDPADLNASLGQVSSTIRGGDVDEIRALLAGFRQFTRENLGSAFGAGTQNLQLVNQASQALVRALQSLGASTFQQGGGLGDGSGFASALEDLKRTFADNTGATNDLLEESNDLARQNLAATKSGGIIGIQSAVSPTLRSVTGIRGAL